MSTGAHPKFSVITVSYNQGEFIKDTIESVLAQKYANFEHIIVDAGSTDNTLEILRQYPHLKWTSEPDRGQSHGLNKGFARATGDIIAWINSDDWYAPGTFHEVASMMQHSPIVMGGCVVTDRVGNPTEEVANLPRDWFDTLKYWVYHSIPTQPGIFFSRALFSELGIDPLNALDEGLEYTMDYDLWMRLQQRYSLTHRSTNTFAYVRNYESNKTGAFMASAYREMSRVFRRHTARRFPSEQCVSVVVPVGLEPLNVSLFVQKLAAQTIKQTELLFVEYSGDRERLRSLRKELRELEPSYPTIALRCQRISALSESPRIEAIDFGVRNSSAPFVAVLENAEIIAPDFITEVMRICAHDSIGVILWGLQDEEKAKLFNSTELGLMFNPIGALQSSLRAWQFVVRRAAWHDCGGFSASRPLPTSESYCVKRLLLQMVHKAWQITSVQATSTISRLEPDGPSNATSLRLYENCSIVDEIGKDAQVNLFTALRQKNGFALTLPESLLQLAQGVLATLPEKFEELCSSKDIPDMRRAVEMFPSNGPLRMRLITALRGVGENSEADEHLKAWSTIREWEQQCPLFGA